MYLQPSAYLIFINDLRDFYLHLLNMTSDTIMLLISQSTSVA
jgi:hypothetical protein